MRIITQFKPNMTFRDYYKSMKPGDLFILKNNPMIYMVTDEPKYSSKFFVNEYGVMCTHWDYCTFELLAIVRRESDPLSTVYRTLDYMF